MIDIGEIKIKHCECKNCGNSSCYTCPIYWAEIMKYISSLEDRIDDLEEEVSKSQKINTYSSLKDFPSLSNRIKQEEENKKAQAATSINGNISHKSFTKCYTKKKDSCLEIENRELIKIKKIAKLNSKISSRKIMQCFCNIEKTRSGNDIIARVNNLNHNNATMSKSRISVLRFISVNENEQTIDHLDTFLDMCIDNENFRNEVFGFETAEVK